MSFKRQRSSSPSPSSSSSPPASPTASKLLRTTQDVSHPSLVCNLPPTCTSKPTLLVSIRELESHYATYHTHVCEHKGCGCVFPDARLLELHFAECHDPITALKKDRGEKTFACHLSSCHRLFLNPKARRLHLIQAHGYPNEYFFAVTNKGIGGLLVKWGEGVTLIRGKWKPRVQDQNMDSASESEAEDTSKHFGVEQLNSHLMDDDERLHSEDDHKHSLSTQPSDSSQPDPLVDALSSLTLVPNKIRFGRGGKKGGFMRPPTSDHRNYTASNMTPGKVRPKNDHLRRMKRRGGGGGRGGVRRELSEGMSSPGGERESG